MTFRLPQFSFLGQSVWIQLPLARAGRVGSVGADGKTTRSSESERARSGYLTFQVPESVFATRLVA
jgi:hypothetical protein